MSKHEREEQMVWQQEDETTGLKMQQSSPDDWTCKNFIVLSCFNMLT